jgi:glycosyltransferase involved in cell wall biosynthesis
VRERGLDGRVVLRGQISEAALQQAYAAADAFVLPAIVDRRGDTEGLGVVLLEAMNHKVPVVASRIGGILDIVEDGVSGLLVPPGGWAAEVGRGGWWCRGSPRSERPPARAAGPPCTMRWRRRDPIAVQPRRESP